MYIDRVVPLGEWTSRQFLINEVHVVPSNEPRAFDGTASSHSPVCTPSAFPGPTGVPSFLIPFKGDVGRGSRFIYSRGSRFLYLLMAQKGSSMAFGSPSTVMPSSIGHAAIIRTRLTSILPGDFDPNSRPWWS
jgi:hypothetical protein